MKTSLNRPASSRHLVSWPPRRTPSASFSSVLRVSISRLQLRNGPGGGRLIENARLRVRDFLFRCVVEFHDVVRVELRRPERDANSQLSAALEHLQLAQAALQPLPPPAQRLIDRLG